MRFTAIITSPPALAEVNKYFQGYQKKVNDFREGLGEKNVLIKSNNKYYGSSNSNTNYRCKAK